MRRRKWKKELEEEISEEEGVVVVEGEDECEKEEN